MQRKNDNKNFIEGIHFYYNKDNFIVFTEKYHLQRGYCCGSGCLHCPYKLDEISESLKSNLREDKQNDKQKK